MTIGVSDLGKMIIFILVEFLYIFLFYSSVQLLGDLLYRISGVSGKMSTETASDDDNFGTEHSHKVCRFKSNQKQ